MNDYLIIIDPILNKTGCISLDQIQRLKDVLKGIIVGHSLTSDLQFH
ncbi:MAG: hypothetical protein KAX49_16765 [Halanaerobiales bacterium]|nr:hypothetical protein [Halanaerobiales bacterium]